MKLRIFLSWQTATDAQGFNNKSLLIDCVQKSIKQIENKGMLKGISLELKEGMRGEPGHPDVAETMMQLVDSCDIFIGDMTVTQNTGGVIGDVLRFLKIQNIRKEPNSNVYGEYHRALGKFPEFCKQTVLVLNTVNGNPERDVEVIPFDTRGKRFPITFTLKNDKEKAKEKARKQLMASLPKAIQDAAMAAKNNIDKKFLPFITWKNHVTKNEFSGQYEWTNSLLKIKEQLHDCVGIIRLLGLSGLGKTRLVLESFRNSDVQDRYLYCDCHEYEHKNIKMIIETIFEDYNDAILILDNCDQNLLGDVIKLRKSLSAGTKVITIFNQPNENRSHCEGINYIEMDEKYQEVVDKILKRFNVLKNDELNRIKEFSDGIPLMAELLVKGLQNGHDIGDLGDIQLISKMLGCDQDSDDRKVLQSLSLFDYLGHENERRDEMVFVATTHSITSINRSSDDLLINLFDETIEKYIKRTILEKRGRQIGIRPTPLAMYLISEWLDGCSKERMLAVVTSIQKSKLNGILVSGFHNQFKNMGFNSKAREILNKLMGIDSPFGSAEVLNTKVGSHLFRTFVEVNPTAVSGLLSRVLGSMNIKSLKGIDEGRRNLVWTLEKLCFNNSTFHEGAYLMMRLGLAENETWSNNATGDFIRIFPIYLPATSASLNERLHFLQEHISDEENKPLIMLAIKRALSARDFNYTGGAEEQGVKKLKWYEPTSSSEIITYVKGCLDIVMAEIQNNTEYAKEAKDILESNIISLCMFRLADVVLPYIENAATIFKNDWDIMQEKLTFFEDSCIPYMSKDNQTIYRKIILILTKNDFISRFRRIEKENRLTRDFESRIEQQRKKYKSMAEEFLESEELDENLLQQLIETKCISSYPFGEHLSQLMDSEQQKMFVSKYVKIANTLENPNCQILVDFVSIFDEQSFDESLQKLLELHDTRYIFTIWGRRGYKVENKKFNILVNLIDNNIAKSSDFIQYCSNITIGSQSEEEIIKLLSVILPLQNGFATIMNLRAMMMFEFGNSSCHKLDEFIADAIINYNDNVISVLFVENATHIANNLLKTNHSDKLAFRMHKAILNYIKTADGYVSIGYDIDELYRILFTNYFDIIWPDLSEALLSDNDDYMIYYRLKNIIGVSMIGDNSPIFQEGNHEEKYLEWCEQYPDKAPARIMSIVSPVDNEGHFIPIVLKILDKYADRPYVLNELGCNIGSFCSIGSVIPYYEAQKKTYKTLLNHPNKEVKNWAIKHIEDCNNMIEKEKIIEVERW